MLSADDQPLETITPTSRHCLPKWPFFLGDAVLVVAALAVWFSTHAATTAQMVFCLGMVAFGAVIFILPYMLEKIFPDVGDYIAGERSPTKLAGEDEWRRQARAAAEAVEHAARANAALESSARRFDARFAPLVEVQQSLTAAVAELRETAAARANVTAGESLAIQRECERMRKEQAEKFKMVEEKLAVLGEAIAMLGSHLKAAPPRSEPSAAVVKSRRSAVWQKGPAAPVQEPVLAGEVTREEANPDLSSSVANSKVVDEIAASTSVDESESSSVEASSMTVGAITEPPKVDTVSTEETSMLAKALARAQSSGQTPAVAGIIMARVRRPRKTKSQVPEVTNIPAVSSDPLPAIAADSFEAPVTPIDREGWQTLSEGKFDTVSAGETLLQEKIAGAAAVEASIEPLPTKIERSPGGDTSSAFRRSARAKVIALRGEDNEVEAKAAPILLDPVRTDGPAAQTSDGPTQGELLAREAETIRKRRSSRSPVQTTSLMAKVLIGIGNKPFVRGTGPGLSQEKGVPMEFVEIGQWRWVAPGMVKEPIMLRILKNDEIPAEGEPLVLHPGQLLTVSPQFPSA